MGDILRPSEPPGQAPLPSSGIGPGHPPGATRRLPAPGHPGEPSPDRCQIPGRVDRTSPSEKSRRAPKATGHTSTARGSTRELDGRIAVATGAASGMDPGAVKALAGAGTPDRHGAFGPRLRARGDDEAVAQRSVRRTVVRARAAARAGAVADVGPLRRGRRSCAPAPGRPRAAAPRRDRAHRTKCGKTAGRRHTAVWTAWAFPTGTSTLRPRTPHSRGEFQVFLHSGRAGFRTFPASWSRPLVTRTAQRHLTRSAGSLT